MKFCVLYFSDDASHCKDFPSYTKSHKFYTKFIRRETVREELEGICRGDVIYDFYWPFLGGAAGLDGLKYLESKKLPILGTSSKFLSMNKLDMKRLLSIVGILTPGLSLASEKSVEEMKFPLILSSADGHRSICTDEDQWAVNLDIHKSNVGEKNVFSEEIIEGKYISMMVLETINGVIPLQPIMEKLLDSDKEIENGEFAFKIYDEDTLLLKKLKETGVKAYESLGVLGSGYAKLNFCVTEQGDIYVMDIHPSPGFLSKPEDSSIADFVIEKTFPGGHEALLETIISSKKRFDDLIVDFDEMAKDFDEIYFEDDTEGIGNPILPFVDQFDFDGTILDVGCGSGSIGGVIMAKHPGVKITGIDASPKMAQLAFEKGYADATAGLAENLIMEESRSFDHVLSFGMFPFIDHSNYIKILSRMFCLAKRSVSLTVEDITQEYNDKMVQLGFAYLECFNHMRDFENFQVPPQWVLVHKKWEFLWESPTTGVNMYGLVIRFVNKLCSEVNAHIEV